MFNNIKKNSGSVKKLTNVRLIGSKLATDSDPMIRGNKNIL
tara:strand:+ start:43 stop:165 length:123 start_codon:yes stop_codon:yes gene_type:complete